MYGRAAATARPRIARHCSSAARSGSTRRLAGRRPSRFPAHGPPHSGRLAAGSGGDGRFAAGSAACRLARACCTAWTFCRALGDAAACADSLPRRPHFLWHTLLERLCLTSDAIARVLRCREGGLSARLSRLQSFNLQHGAIQMLLFHGTIAALPTLAVACAAVAICYVSKRCAVGKRSLTVFARAAQPQPAAGALCGEALCVVQLNQPLAQRELGM